MTTEVRLRGSARSPELSLASQPPLDQIDILSRIVFNRPVNTLGTGERQNLAERASDQDTGAVLIGNQIGSRLFFRLRQEFGKRAGSVVAIEYRISDLLRFVTTVGSGGAPAESARRRRPLTRTSCGPIQTSALFAVTEELSRTNVKKLAPPIPAAIAKDNGHPTS